MDASLFFITNSEILFIINSVSRGEATPTNSKPVKEVQHMTIYHNHHIIPKHIGGTDDPSNLVRLTVEEHAEAHQKLYEEHGRWQDYCAWKSLSGQITDSERNILRSKNRDTSYMQSEEYSKKVSEACKGRSPTKGCFQKGHKRSKQSIEKQKSKITGKKRGPYKYNHEKCSKKVTVYGKEYPSVAAAKRDTGHSYYTIMRLQPSQWQFQEPLL